MTTSPMAQAVLHDGWAELILSRPARKNAFVGPMVADLQAGLATLLAGGDQGDRPAARRGGLRFGPGCGRLCAKIPRRPGGRPHGPSPGPTGTRPSIAARL